MTDSNTKTPASRLASLIACAPPELRDKIISEAAFAAGGELMRARILSKMGPALPISEITSLAKVAAESYADVLSKSPERSAQVTATVRDIAAQIGELIDYSIRRMHGPDGIAVSCNAYMDIVAGHATLMRGITALNNLPDDDNGDAAA